MIAKESIETDAGIWIPGHDNEDEESGNESEQEEDEEAEKDSSEISLDEIDEEEGLPPVAGIGRFGALQINDGESEDGEDEGEDEEEE